MTTFTSEDRQIASTCGCGRSPTGKCIGWHSLTEEEYAREKSLYEYKLQAQSLWSDSCTSRRSE